MQKFRIILLALCLVSVHAFVKRDTEPPKNEDYLKTLQTKFEDFGKDVGDQISKALNPEEIKKNFNELVDNVNKAISEIQPKTPK